MMTIFSTYKLLLQDLVDIFLGKSIQTVKSFYTNYIVISGSINEASPHKWLSDSSKLWGRMIVEKRISYAF